MKINNKIKINNKYEIINKRKFYPLSTMATASFKTLSPNTRA